MGVTQKSEERDVNWVTLCPGDLQKGCQCHSQYLLTKTKGSVNRLMGSRQPASIRPRALWESHRSQTGWCRHQHTQQTHFLLSERGTAKNN